MRTSVTEGVKERMSKDNGNLKEGKVSDRRRDRQNVKGNKGERSMERWTQK